MIAGETGDRRRRARLREGHAGRAPRPAPAPRARPDAARLRPLGVQLPRLARGGAPAARGRDGRAAGRRHAPRPVLARAGSPRARRWLGLAQPRAGPAARARLRRPSSSTATLSTFSGGELTRASLARALAGDPDLLLLDEPTNHLDIASLEWLEDYLTGLDAAVILVAHDRWFLEAVGTSVLELEAGRARFFPGTWHAWRREAAARDIQLGKRSRSSRPRSRGWSGSSSASATRRRRRARRSRASRSSTRWSGSSATRATTVARVQVRRRGAHRARGARARPAARIEVPGRTLLEDGELWLERGEHVSLVGPERRRQDDADRGARRPPRARRRQAPHRPQRADRLPVPARRGARLERAPCSRRRSAPPS